MTKAYSYLRFSTPEQERGDSFRRQTSMADAYAERHGLELDNRSFQDLGVSAFRGANAETGMFGEFLDLVRSRSVPRGSYLLVESLDRLSRNKPRKAMRLLESICEEGIIVVTLADGRVYDEATLDDDPMAFMWAFMVAMRANEESATKSRRLKAAWGAKRQRASDRPLTARAPYWLTLDRTTWKFDVVEDRAAVVRRVFAMALEGIGQHRIAETLNAEGVPVFGDGQFWHRSYIAKLLSNPAVVGTFIPHSVEYEEGRKRRRPSDPVEGYFPAVVERAVFDNVQAMRDQARAPLRGRHASAGVVNNLFGGLARCPICDGTMTRVSKGPNGGKPYLVCAAAKAGSGCRYRGVRCDYVEERFLEDLPRVIATAPSGDPTGALDDEIDQIEASIDAIHGMIANIMRGIERGAPASVTERQRLRDLETELEQKQREHDELLDRRAAVAGPLVAQRLDQLLEAAKAPELDRKRVNTLLRQLLAGAVVDYRRGQLVLKWKHGGESYVTIGWPEEEELAAGSVSNEVSSSENVHT